MSLHRRRCLNVHSCSFTLASSEDKASPAAEGSQPADVVESPKETPLPPQSPADRPASRGSASSGSQQSSSEDDDDDDDGEHNGTHRKIRSSVAQIRVSIKYLLYSID